jgi:transposase
MKRKRRHLTAEFKARVALEALRGEKTAAEIARENEIAPAQISEWKRQLEERLTEVFQSKGERSRDLEAQEKTLAKLERKIGQLVIERDFLVKKCEQLGIDPSEKP